MILTRLKHLLLDTLRRQLTVGMAVLVAAIMLLFVLDTTRRQQVHVMEQQSRQAQSLAQGVARASAVWLGSRDFAGLQEIVDGLDDYPDLSHAIVLDPQGLVLAHSDAKRRGLYLSDLPAEAKTTILQRTEALVDAASPVMLGGKPIGWVRIGLGGETLAAEITAVRQHGAWYALLAIVLSVAFATFAGGVLSRRLQAIQKVADAVQAGDASLRVRLQGDDEAARLGRQFNAMLDSLLQQQTELQRFAEITAHHLQEPARRIATYADRLTRQLAGKLDDEQTRLSLEFINQQARRQKNLLRDVERYLAATQPRGEVIRIAPRATLEQMLLGMAEQIRAAGATIELRALPPARIDLPRLKDLFAVALDNALKHGLHNEQGLHITIAGERVGEHVRYRVSDNGAGVATEFREQVFLVFERLTSSGEGTGIGLAILRRVAESTDGRAWIETTPGGGCSVVFELPLGETP